MFYFCSHPDASLHLFPPRSHSEDRRDQWYENGIIFYHFLSLMRSEWNGVAWSCKEFSTRIPSIWNCPVLPPSFHLWRRTSQPPTVCNREAMLLQSPWGQGWNKQGTPGFRNMALSEWIWIGYLSEFQLRWRKLTFLQKFWWMAKVLVHPKAASLGSLQKAEPQIKSFEFPRLLSLWRAQKGWELPHRVSTKVKTVQED